MYIWVQESQGRLMLHISHIVNVVNYVEVLHDLLRGGKVRALNEKPHQHLPKPEISVLHCSVTPSCHWQILSFLHKTNRSN